MSNLLSGINARLRVISSKAGGLNNSHPTPEELQKTNDTSQSSMSSSSSTPLKISLPESPSSSQTIHTIAPNVEPAQPLPLWRNPAFSKHIVKGNFMTLSACPKTVEQGEWIAHQVVEQYRNLLNITCVVYDEEDNGHAICNSSTCSRMSAGKNHSYTWLNANNELVELSAHEYMTLIQRWISGKIEDMSLFPTDPLGVYHAQNPQFPNSTPLPCNGNEDWLGKRSGFPKEFQVTCQLIFRQIFRVYAHLYWDHFIEPFYHLNLERQLNSYFSHFILTATTLDMLQHDELQPMQPLIDLWAADGTLPPLSTATPMPTLSRADKT